ncbi:MAG: TetR/AcrR family transcriptional regulator [Actinobacteria bacterium]|nr:TetR/AcrR family transcriptional regulator [Actinomycetota bacterium]
MKAPEVETRHRILAAAKEALLEMGFAKLSTRRIASAAGVPLSQIHYHFGSKQNLVFEVLEEENRKLLGRQSSMYQSDMPVWKQWEQACDFLEDDLDSGYVRVLQEMVAAGWSDAEIAAAVRQAVMAWFELLTWVAERAEEKLGNLGPFTPGEIGALAGLPFLGAETLILLGVEESDLPSRSALRKIAALIRTLEEEVER